MLCVNNLPKMFTNQNLESNVKQDPRTKDLHLEIKLLNTEILEEDENQDNLRKSLYNQLNQYLYYHKLCNTPSECIFNEICDILDIYDLETEDLDQIKDLFENKEIEDLQSQLSSNEENSALEMIAEKISSNIPTINDDCGFTSLISDLISLK